MASNDDESDLQALLQLDALAAVAKPRRGLARKATSIPSQKSQWNLSVADTHLMNSYGLFIQGHNC